MLDIALRMNDEPWSGEVQARRSRAECLRALDVRAHQHRETMAEHCPPEERLALLEALAEIDRALACDEYDAELWNFKAAWSYLLARPEEAIRCASRSIELRPNNYAKPWTNKAAALWRLGRGEEALGCAQEALRQAAAVGSAPEIEQQTRMIRDFSDPQREPSLEDFEPVLEQMLHSANVACDEELGQAKSTADDLVKGVLDRARRVREDRSIAFVPLVADLLALFTPQAAFTVFLGCAAHSQRIHMHCLHAGLYIACHTEGTQQRDAARFMNLSLFGALKASEVRIAYRQAVLETSAAGRGRWAGLAAIMREDLARLNPNLPKLVAEQDPVDGVGYERASSILRHFAGEPPQPELPTEAVFPSFVRALWIASGLILGFIAVFRSC
jgi:hypothetical protein